MRCYIFLGACVLIAQSNAQYDQPPEGHEGGNPYYENEGPPPQYEGQEPAYQPPERPVRNQAHQAPHAHQAPQAHVVHRNQEPALTRRTTALIANETFTLPPFYYSISTTEKTVKINRRTYPQMLDTLLKDGALKTARVIEAFNKVDRGYFVHPMEDEPYGFMTRKLGRGVFMEKPHFQAKIVELLAPKIKEGAKVLDVGSGTGFLSSVFSELAGKTGQVIGVEHMREQCEDAWDNVMKVRPDLLTDGRLHLRCRDGRVGLQNHGPYDAIYFSPYVPEIPYTILLQLKPGGRLICGIGKLRVFQRLVQIDRSEDGETFIKHDLGSENFINPLCSSNDQNDNWLYQQSRRRIVEAKSQGFSGIQLARKLRLFTKKPCDFRKLEDDTYRFIEV